MFSYQVINPQNDAIMILQLFDILTNFDQVLEDKEHLYKSEQLLEEASQSLQKDMQLR